MVSTTRRDQIQTRSRTREQAHSTAALHTANDSQSGKQTGRGPADGPPSSNVARATVEPVPNAIEQHPSDSSGNNKAGVRRKILECAKALRDIVDDAELWDPITAKTIEVRQAERTANTADAASPTKATPLRETANKETQTDVKPSARVSEAILAIDSLSRTRAVLELRQGHLSRAQEKLHRREAHLLNMFSKYTMNGTNEQHKHSLTAEELVKRCVAITSAQRSAVQRWERAKKLEATMRDILKRVQTRVDALHQSIPEMARAALAPAPNPNAGELLALVMEKANKQTPASLFTDSPDDEEDEEVLDGDAPGQAMAPPAEIALRRSAMSQLIGRCKVAKAKRETSRAWSAAFLRSRTIEPLPGETQAELNRRYLEALQVLNEDVRVAESEFSEVAREAQDQDVVSTSSMSGRFPLYDRYPDFGAAERQAEIDHSMQHTDYAAIDEWVPRPGTGLSNDVDRTDLTGSESGWYDGLLDVALGEEVNDWETDHRRRKYIDSWQEDPWSLFEHQMEVEWPDARVDRPDVGRWGPDLAPETIDRRDTTTIVEAEDRGIPVEQLETRSDPGVGGSSNGSSDVGARPRRRGMWAACPHM
ncbi:uncharacterized protein AB675_11470 [Cyphellophora attinorum]|uniref:Uncharacterized protein n=1 Tax=Cyphellophora attinorum TaxID=1664694 RepID=A0A0N1H4C9_9EURO|nr:uncharacterized protein AB675_11470 [Phialophora attinorum]KPI40164.1 hypothetical protein AB675_11470 [Phialophora attinorum]